METPPGPNVLRNSFEGLELPDSIIVTSASAIKINTVQKALQRFFPGRTFNVIGVKASSGINEQPVGNEAEQGARNRIESAHSIVPVELTSVEKAFVSIESGIFETPAGAWEDKAVAVIQLPNESAFSGISPRGVEFPVEAVNAARAKEGGFEKNTVGSVIAEMYAAQGVTIDKQDPQSALTGGSFTREEQMISAIREALLRAAGN